MATLLNPKLLKSCVEKFNFPENEKRQRINTIISGWQTAFKEHDLSKAKETSLQGKFFAKFFCEILGYTMQDDGGEVWTLKQEAKTEVDGKEADGSLGYYSKNNAKTRCVIELKDAQCNLDSKQQSRENKQTPVEQAFQYLYKFADCDWVIVSNFRYTRLYHKSKGQTAYEEFDILNLHEEKEFKRFYYCLCKENLLNEQAKSPMDLLIKQSSEADIDITKEFYSEFKQVRKILFNHIVENNPDLDKKLLLEKTQKLLDRFIFIFFCEDTSGLLPHNTVENIYKMAQNSFSLSECKIWEQFRGLFVAIDKGNNSVNPPINAYNGGLFAYDEILDKLIIKDEMFKSVTALARYDFDSDLNVNILGHIFEQSLSDLEQIKNELDGIQEDKKNSKRKKDGIFYTPEYITHYIVEETIGRYLEENPDKLETIKILDPACGSGAFLNQAHSFLLKQRQIRIEEKINAEKSHKRGGTEYVQTDLFKHTNQAEHDRSILLNNLFGVDLNKESVEITKLALWLKTANSQCKLNNLDENIKCGNSLIDDETIAGDEAFKWETEYKEIMQNGGFDVIIGNPPYVDNRDFNKEQLSYFFNTYEVFTKTGVKQYKTRKFNTFVAFIERVNYLLNDNGIACFIVHKNLLKTNSYAGARAFMLKYFDILEITDWGAGQFEGVIAETISIILTKKRENNHFVKITQNNDKHIQQVNSIQQNIFNSSVDNIFNIYNDTEILNILKSIENNKTKLEKYININNGVVTGNDKLFISNKQNTEFHKKCISGKDIKRYLIHNHEKYVYYKPDELLRPRNINIFTADEKLIMQMININLVVAYDNSKIFNLGTTYSLTSKNTKIHLKYILAILNSKLMNFYYQRKYTNSSTLTNAISTKNLYDFPIPTATEEQQNSLSQKADKMIELNNALQEESKKAIELIELEYKPKKISQKLETFYTLGLNPFIEELEKLGVKLSPTQKENLISWYKTKSELLNKIKTEIDTLDHEIDQEVYKLYNLTDEEIKIIEGV